MRFIFGNHVLFVLSLSLKAPLVAGSIHPFFPYLTLIKVHQICEIMLPLREFQKRQTGEIIQLYKKTKVNN